MTEKPNRKSAGQPPVSAHPAFPVIVAVWFAALLAIGSVVLPLSMFENLAVSSGLSDTFDALQPPLGTNARIAVAIVAAVLGALLGVFVARKVAAATVQGPDTRSAGATRLSPKRPISAHDELDEDGIGVLGDDAPAPDEPFAGRRRSLAAVDEHAPSDFLAVAPLPGESDTREEPLDLLKFEQAWTEESEVEHEADLSACEPAPSATLSWQEEAAWPEHSEPSSAERHIAPPVSDRPLSELGMVELVERFAIALERHRERAEKIPAAGSAVFEAPQPVSRAQAKPDPRQWDAPPHHPLSAALRPFEFEQALSDAEDESADVPEHDFAATLSFNRGALPADPDWSEDPNEARDEAAFDEEFDDTAEAEYTSLLSMKSPLGQQREPVRIDHLDDEPDAGDGPVVVFPGQASRRPAPALDENVAQVSGTADSARAFDAPLARIEQAAARTSFAATRKPGNPADTEQALREALEKLQKMSGAA